MIATQLVLFPELPRGGSLNFCGECHDPMPPGQTGCCALCGRTEFDFDELSDIAKQAAREHYTSGDYPYDAWCEPVYNTAKAAGRLLGVEVSDITFSGFWSQGDGCSFSGTYSINSNAINDILAEWDDKTLSDIAERLTHLQINRRMLGLEPITATISYRGSYRLLVELYEESFDADDEDTFRSLMQKFANWIYAQLENEYNYLCSDEYVDERLREDGTKFDEDGRVI